MIGCRLSFRVVLGVMSRLKLRGDLRFLAGVSGIFIFSIRLGSLRGILSDVLVVLWKNN
jgi:hypothetical protein